MTRAARLRELAARVLRRASWAGVIGLGLIALAVLISAAGTRWVAERRAELAAERSRLAAAPTAAGGGAGLRGAASVADFHAGFPAAQALPRTLARIYDLADTHGLTVDRTAYRSADEAGTPLLRVSLQLPVQGGYGEVYAWLGEMLAAMPEVALEAISVRRVEPAADLIEAEVRLLVFVRRGA